MDLRLAKEQTYRDIIDKLSESSFELSGKPYSVASSDARVLGCWAEVSCRLR